MARPLQHAPDDDDDLRFCSLYLKAYIALAIATLKAATELICQEPQQVPRYEDIHVQINRSSLHS